LDLDFSLVQNGPEAFPAAIKESYCEFGSLSVLVFSASHLPSFLWSAHFSLTFGAFSHNIPFEAVYHDVDKTFSIVQSLSGLVFGKVQES